MAAEHHNPIVRRLEGPATMRKLLLLAHPRAATSHGFSRHV
jgi:hypothetical protein